MARYTHVALYVDDLRTAEEFYTGIFAAEVLFREALTSDGTWATMPTDADWDDAANAGVELHMAVLRFGEIHLPLFVGQPAPRIVGLELSEEEISGLRARLPVDVNVLTDGAGHLEFVDPFAVHWQVRSRSGFSSQGEMHGRWLEI